MAQVLPSWGHLQTILLNSALVLGVSFVRKLWFVIIVYFSLLNLCCWSLRFWPSPGLQVRWGQGLCLSCPYYSLASHWPPDNYTMFNIYEMPSTCLSNKFPPGNTVLYSPVIPSSIPGYTVPICCMCSFCKGIQSLFYQVKSSRHLHLCAHPLKPRLHPQHVFPHNILSVHQYVHLQISFSLSHRSLRCGVSYCTECIKVCLKNFC